LTDIIYPELSYKIIGAAMKVHKELGSGFLEKVYENSMMVMFKNYKIKAVQQASIKVHFMNEIVGNYIADILVEDKIILELKIIDRISNIHKAQTLNYLKATGLKLAILINFKKQSIEYQRILL
jgi:GxxExxY protein